MNSSISAQIPLPLQVVIDDVGWWSGRDDSEQRGPYRTGIKRNHVAADYEAIVSLGRQLNIKPQTGFVVCEWDRHNILRRLPSCNWMGEKWDNTVWNGPWHEEAAQIIRDGEPYMDLMLHAVGHEYWAYDAKGNWTFTRAEWYDTNGTMRPRDGVLARLDLFQEILDEHDLGGFPTTFVPCAGVYRYEKSQGGFAPLLKAAGIDFVSTPFSIMHGTEDLSGQRYVFDDGIITVDRGEDPHRWNSMDVNLDGKTVDLICGMHWPNLLHADPERNEEVVGKWVKFLRREDAKPDRTLSPDTANFAVQLVYHSETTSRALESGLELDFTALRSLPIRFQRQRFLVKVVSPICLEFHSDTLEILAVKSHLGADLMQYELLLRPTSGMGTEPLFWNPL